MYSWYYNWNKFSSSSLNSRSEFLTIDHKFKFSNNLNFKLLETLKLESFGGFCGDNMGKNGLKTVNIWGSILKKTTLGDWSLRVLVLWTPIFFLYVD